MHVWFKSTLYVCVSVQDSTQDDNKMGADLHHDPYCRAWDRLVGQ